MGQKLANNAFATLDSAISAGDTTIVLTTGHGSRFPSLSAGEYFYATLDDLADNIEIVKVTARVNDTLTVVRGQDGTTAKAYQAGTIFELRPTRVLIQAATQEASVAILLSGTNNYSGTLSPVPQAYETNQVYWFRFSNTNTSSGTTVELSGLGEVDLRRRDGGQFLPGEIPTGVALPFSYTGLQFRALFTSFAYLRDGSLGITGSLNQPWLTTGGTSTAYTITPESALSEYAVGHSYLVQFHVACGANPTLQISGLASPPNLVKRNADGTLSNLLVGDIQTNWRSRVTLLSATQALVETPASGSFSATTLGRGSSDTLTINAGTWTIGSNYTATRAAGALGTGTHYLQTHVASFSGHSGGGTNAITFAKDCVIEGANNVTQVQASRLMTRHNSSGNVALLLNNYSTVALTSSGNISVLYEYYADLSISGSGSIAEVVGFKAGNIGHATKVETALGFDAADMTASTFLTAAYRGLMSSGTGKYNLYMSGSAMNYLAGNLGVRAHPNIDVGILTLLDTTTGVNTYGCFVAGTIQPNVTNTAFSFRSSPSTAAASFTAAALIHFSASQGTIGSGSSVISQIGFYADYTFTGATNNFGFYGQIPAGTGRWNLYMAGSAANWFAGDLTIYGATAIPSGGTTGTGYKFSSTSNFGIFFGSGAPTLSAAKGSLYLRSDGSGMDNRLYVNTDGGTGWTAVTTVS